MDHGKRITISKNSYLWKLLKMEVSISNSLPLSLARWPSLATVPPTFQCRFLFPSANPWFKAYLIHFVSSSSSILYSLLALNLTVEGEMKERIPDKISLRIFLPWPRFSTNSAETTHWALKHSSWRTQRH